MNWEYIHITRQENPKTDNIWLLYNASAFPHLLQHLWIVKSTFEHRLNCMVTFQQSVVQQGKTQLPVFTVLFPGYPFLGQVA